MEQLTCATLFSGGGGKTIGFMNAGFKPVLAVEIDPKIAAVYADNLGGGHLRVGDVREIDYSQYAGVDLLGISPVCKRVSPANMDKTGETDLDITTAEAAGRAILQMNPRFVMVENVPAYRKTESLKRIIHALEKGRYWWDIQILNCADFGVPQTRKRFILRATREGMLPPLPSPVPWNGWYNAVSDLLPQCEDSKLANWQIERLGSDFVESLLVAGGSAGRGVWTNSPSDSPSPTIKANAGTREPFRAVLVEGDAAGMRPPTIRNGEDPMYTLKTSTGGRVHRAVLFRPKKYGPEERGKGYFEAESQKATLLTDNPHLKAVLFRVNGESSEVAVSATSPSPTLTADGAGKLRAYDEPRIVALSPRCLARLQSVPDWYKLPESKTLACTIIGNMVPPLLAEAMAEQWS